MVCIIVINIEDPDDSPWTLAGVTAAPKLTKFPPGRGMWNEQEHMLAGSISIQISGPSNIYNR